MSIDNWGQENERVVKALKIRLGDKQTCFEVIDGYDEIMRLILDFTTRLLGVGGARAVLSRSLKVASRQAPLIQLVEAGDQGVDFTVLRDHVTRFGCGAPEVLDALTTLGVAIFQTLSELTGEALTEPLLRSLEEDSPDDS